MPEKGDDQRQADGGFRQEVADIGRLKTRNDAGAMVPIESVAQFSDKTGPYRLTRYNLSPASEVQGSAAPGASTGTALRIMEDLAAFTNDIHGYIMSGGAVKPRMAGAGAGGSAKPSAQARTAAPAQSGSEPLRTPTTAK